MKSSYIAHRRMNDLESFEDQSVKDHLRGTAEYARQFAEKFDAADYGWCCGNYHDLGKYSYEFQKRIKENGPKVDHSTAGAKEIKIFPIQLAICGHHSGLLDYGSQVDRPEDKTLCGRLKKTVPDYSAFQTEVKLMAPENNPVLKMNKQYTNYTVSFFCRMLYSCLVDADFLDTENFMADKNRQRQGFDSWSVLYNRVKQRTDKFLGQTPDGELNYRRNEILKTCIETGNKKKRGAFTLTVPTGGGKTISSLAFAMEQLISKKMDRIIYVIPYTSIIDQTVSVFENILGEKNVLAHHSNVDFDDINESSQQDINRKKLATENWDAPVIVTTNVQFFESLHGHRSSQCRKLHNLTNSVIIFDEAQMLPVPYLIPCIQSIGELVRNYRCTTVLCTATQPSLDSLFPKDIPLIEICPETAKLYEIFRRVQYDQMGTISMENLVHKLNAHDQVLCIVNTRQQAYQLFTKLNCEGTYHLSTWMYPKHRQEVLKTIRERLKAGLSCRVVSTSLVEAGVDLDFPVVYRALTGLDSIIQAGGRCNREGRHPIEESNVWVFELEEKKQRQLSDYIETTRSVISKFEKIDSPNCIKSYFALLFGLKDSGLDAKSIIEKIKSFSFETISRDFKMIEEDSHTIFITNDLKANELLKKYRLFGPSRELLRQIGKYMVSLPTYQFTILEEHKMIERLDESLAVLIFSEDYSNETGLKIPESEAGGMIQL